MKSPHSTYVQVAGKAQRITGTELTNGMNASETLHGLALTFADGMAVRSPDATAMDLIRRGVDRIVVPRPFGLFIPPPTIAQRGARAAALAALLKERERLHGPAAVILSGQNIDRTWMQTVLAGGTPRVS